MVNRNVLEFEKTVDVPVGAAQVVLALCILDQVDLLAALDRIAIWNQNDFAELADDVARVGVADGRVVFHLLVKSKVLMRFANHEWSNRFFNLLLFHHRLGCTCDLSHFRLWCLLCLSFISVFSDFLLS